MKKGKCNDEVCHPATSILQIKVFLIFGLPFLHQLVIEGCYIIFFLLNFLVGNSPNLGMSYHLVNIRKRLQTKNYMLGPIHTE